MKRAVFVLTITLLLIHPAFGQTVFEKADFEVRKDTYFSQSVGDWNEDGHLDIYFDTIHSPTTNQFEIYNNNVGSLTEAINITFAHKGHHYFLNDYDRDNTLELLGVGEVARVFNPITKSFVPVGFDFDGERIVDAKLFDFDNDGDTDILYNTTLYENINGSFIALPINFESMTGMRSSICDFDSDGDIDVLTVGSRVSGPSAGVVYKNTSEGFSEVFLHETTSYTRGAWGDYDNDGDFDLVLPHYYGPTKIFRNDDGSFVLAYEDLPKGSVCHWGDYNNDGYLDLVVGGDHWIHVYRNSNGALAKADSIPASFDDITYITWADMDNDGHLDLISSAEEDDEPFEATNIYFNKLNNSNTKPTAPSNLSSDIDGTEVTLNWQAGSDSETPTQSLTYNIRLGTTPGGAEIIHPLSEINSSKSNYGYRRVVEYGNAYMNTSWTLDLHRGTYYWSVQTIDQAYSGSPFASERSFTINADKFETLFTELDFGFPGVASERSAAWGDYDNDGDLDILLAGETQIDISVTEIYRNDGNDSFTEIPTNFKATKYGQVAWGDYDRDEDLDILATGFDSEYESNLYRNDNGNFKETGPGLLDVKWYSSGAWTDTDNDGDLDVFLCGGLSSTSTSKTVLYENKGGENFNQINTNFIGVHHSYAQWGDFDNDYDLDLLLVGREGNGNGVSKIYRNEGNNQFVDLNAPLLNVAWGPVSWVDFDNDSDLDVMLFGESNGEAISKFYKNIGNSTFQEIQSTIPAFYHGGIELADYDNDGDIDALINGTEQGGADYNITALLKNDGFGNFEDSGLVFPQVRAGTSIWGDYDNDNDLDILLTGHVESSPTRITRIYRNDSFPTKNSKPQKPSNLYNEFSESYIIFKWNKASDNETLQNTLTYNLRIGTTSRGSEIMSPMSEDNPNASNHGFRRIVAAGNVSHNTGWKINNSLSVGTYYWSVQAIDQAYAGSPFANEQTFEVGKWVTILAMPRPKVPCGPVHTQLTCQMMVHGTKCQLLVNCFIWVKTSMRMPMVSRALTPMVTTKTEPTMMMAFLF